VTNTAPAYARVINEWAAADHGCSPTGYVNNAAVGRLILNGGLNSLFEFTGAGAANALYVDYLELDGFTATNRDNADNSTGVQIDPGMKIYYGQAVANGTDVSEKLNGKNGGGFCWVSNFNCGFYSSTNLIYPDGSTNRVNIALALSCDIDSNTNGIVNCLDPAPIPNPTCNLPSPLIGLTNSRSSSGGGSSSGSSAGSAPTLGVPAPADSSLSGAATNRFLAAKGTYNGLFYDPSGVTVSSSGYFTASTSDRGAYSGRLTLAGRAYGLSGHFDSAGRATNVLARSRQSPLIVHLQLDLGGGDQIRGLVSDTNWTASLVADRLVYNASKYPASQWGNYTMVVPGMGECGDGIATVKVDKGGNVQWSATLADGTKASQNTTLSRLGIWPLYASLYNGAGEVIAWIQFTNQPASDLSGQTIWFKPGGMRTAYYAGGMTNEVAASGSLYTVPMAGQLVLGMTPGEAAQLTLSGGGLTNWLAIPLSVGLGNRVTVPVGSRVSMSFTPSTGLFKGSVPNPATGKLMNFQGVLLKKYLIENNQAGVGFFLGTDQSGQVLLNPTE
jgi:hypothetical protein